MAPPGISHLMIVFLTLLMISDAKPSKGPHFDASVKDFTNEVNISSLKLNLSIYYLFIISIFFGGFFLFFIDLYIMKIVNFENMSYFLY